MSKDRDNKEPRGTIDNDLYNKLNAEFQRRHDDFLDFLHEAITRARTSSKAPTPTAPKEQEPKEGLPVSIFSKKTTVLESIVKYLKEEKNLSLSEIGETLGRNQKNLWHTYNSAKKKVPSRFEIKESDIFVPISLFSATKYSPTEAIVVYLKEQRQLSLHEIAELLSRDDRTIWTTYSRAKKKHEKK